MTATPTLEAILAAILRDPGDDMPRLAFADALDEQAGERGDPTPCPRAEFVRVQVELHRLRYSVACDHRQGRCPGCKWKRARMRLWKRERELKLEPGEPGTRRMFVCWVGDVPDGLTGGGGEVEYARGFVSAVTCTLDAWLACGPALVLSQPVERVTLSDAIHPREYGGGDERWAVYRSQLGPLWDLLCPGSDPRDVFAERGDRREVEDGLSWAALEYAKRTDPAIP